MVIAGFALPMVCQPRMPGDPGNWHRVASVRCGNVGVLTVHELQIISPHKTREPLRRKPINGRIAHPGPIAGTPGLPDRRA